MLDISEICLNVKSPEESTTGNQLDDAVRTECNEGD